MILDEVAASVSAQLNDQSALGVRIVNRKGVPEEGPVDRGLWWKIPDVTAVFADIKKSTGLSVTGSPKDAAFAYTHFIRAMTVIFEGFSAGYIDIQGDGIFGLFSGGGSAFSAAACAVTMKTHMESTVEPRFRMDAPGNRSLRVGIGVDRGALLVRRLGLRGARLNEVWAGKPVNMAAKLSSVAGNNQVVVSERVFKGYEAGSQLRQKALLCSCGCSGRKRGSGLDIPTGQGSLLWKKVAVPGNLGLDFANAYRLTKSWCPRHGAEFCETVVTGRRPAR